MRCGLGIGCGRWSVAGQIPAQLLQNVAAKYSADKATTSHSKATGHPTIAKAMKEHGIDRGLGGLDVDGGMVHGLRLTAARVVWRPCDQEIGLID